jgi:hypothetical protein
MKMTEDKGRKVKGNENDERTRRKTEGRWKEGKRK